MQIPVIQNYKGLKIAQNLPGSESKDMNRELILDLLLEANEISLPEELVKEETDRQYQGMQQRMKYESMASGNMAAYLHTDMEALYEEARNSVCRQMKTELLLRAIIQQEQLTVTEEELEAEAKKAAERNQMPLEQIKNFFGADFGLLKKDALYQKALDFVCGSAILG